MLLCGCGKQTDNAPLELQTGALDISDLTEGEPYTEEAAPNYEMADENLDPPVETYYRYESADGEVFLFDPAGRLRRYTDHIEAQTGEAVSAEPKYSEEELRGICDEVLSGYIANYSEFTEITSQYYSNDSATYNLAMEHQIADGIADYALIRLDTEGNIHDLSISYSNADGDNTGDFITDEDRAYFDEQAQPYLTALDDYPSEVTYTHYKKIGGKCYAFYEITYTDTMTGLTAGQKLIAFVK